jgi:HD-like signal output (HDOD) protein
MSALVLDPAFARSRALDALVSLDRLPSPGPVALRLASLAAERDVALGEIVRALKCDGALTGRVLRIANSASFARRPVAALEDAVVRVGFAGIRRLALAFSVLECNRAGPCREFDYARHWSHSLARGVAAGRLAHATGRGSPDEAFSVGLLTGIGQLALATAFPGAYGALLRRHPLADAALLEAEETAFGATHVDLGRRMLAAWGLPEPLLAAALPAIGAAPPPGTAAGLFAAAGAIADWCSELGLVPLAPETGALCGIEAACLDDLVADIGVEWATWKAEFRLQG